MTLATRGGEQANQEKADSNFNKCAQLLELGNITSKAEVPGNAPEFRFACGSTVPKTLHTYSHCPSSTAMLINAHKAVSVNCVCILLPPVDSSVRLSAITGYFSRFTLT